MEMMRSISTTSPSSLIISASTTAIPQPISMAMAMSISTTSSSSPIILVEQKLWE
jgi:hypothetical protein